MAVALPLCFLGVNNFWALTPDRIDYRPVLSATTQHHEWSNVEEIETGCSTGKSISYHFVLKLNDKTRIDLMEESPREFSVAYPQIQSALKGNSYRFSSSGLAESCVTSAPQRLFELLSKRPTE
jgi:hypothetical protein